MRPSRLLATVSYVIIYNPARTYSSPAHYCTTVQYRTVLYKTHQPFNMHPILVLCSFARLIICPRFSSFVGQRTVHEDDREKIQHQRRLELRQEGGSSRLSASSRNGFVEHHDVSFSPMIPFSYCRHGTAVKTVHG